MSYILSIESSCDDSYHNFIQIERKTLFSTLTLGSIWHRAHASLMLSGAISCPIS